MASPPMPGVFPDSILGIVGAFVATYLASLSGGMSPENLQASLVLWSVQ